MSVEAQRAPVMTAFIGGSVVAFASNFNLWLVAIRREGEDVSAGKFLAVGALVMPLTLLVTLAIFSWPGTMQP
jgi:Na+/H+ antiporter NhaD/arsenite permease-like protein